MRTWEKFPTTLGYSIKAYFAIGCCIMVLHTVYKEKKIVAEYVLQINIAMD